MLLCVCVSVCQQGDGGIKSHFLIRKGPSWPKALLQLELHQHRTGTTGFVRLLAKNLLRAGSQTTRTHTYGLSQGHTQARMIGVHTHLTPSQHVLSDGKSGLPFPAVHYTLTSTIRLSLERALFLSMNVKCNLAP